MKNIAVAFGLMLCASVANAQNLLMDPSFDASADTPQSNPFWTLDVNMPDSVGTAAQFQNAGWASNPVGTPGVGLWLKAFEGNQNNSGEPAANATLYQDVAAGAGAYDVSFFFRKEANYTSESTLVELLEDGTSIGSIELKDVDTGGVFEQFSFSGVSTGGALRLQAKMVNGVDAMANPQSGMFDDFSLMAVPEPTGISGLLIGFLAVALRRRKSA